MRMFGLSLVFLLTVGIPWVGADSREELVDILSGLRGIEAEMTRNQETMEGLQGEIARLRALGQSADAEILRLQAVVEDHADRVQQLGDRYTQVLALAKKLQGDLEASTTLNWALGAAVTVALLVVGAETLVLAGR